MKSKIVINEEDVTPQPVRDLFDDIAEQEGTPKHSKFAVCRPQYLSTKIPNNKWMKNDNHQEADIPRAMRQWDSIMHITEAFGAELLQIPPTRGAQDAVFCANVACCVEPFMVMANYKAPGRAVEVVPAKRFFESLGYNCITPPFTFEGFADLRKWKDGIYFGGYGLFSDNRAFDWIEEKTGAKIIRLKEVDEGNYHEDCCLAVIDEENFLVNKNSFDEESIRKLEKLANLIFVPEDCDTCGLTNGVRIIEKRLYLSGCFQQEKPEYRKASEWLIETLDGLDYTAVLLDADSLEPSGGDLSCIFLPLDFDPKNP